jgi:predicted transcriptional regulator
MNKSSVLKMTVQVASAYLSRNQLPQSEVGVLVKAVHDALDALETGRPEQGPGNLVPAVPIKKSLTDAYIICLEDGNRLKMLKRYLRAQYNMSPEQYRTKWNLPRDYPMVAPAYAKQRSDFARSIGLGRNYTIPRGRKRR